jgi:putative copper export protein
MQAEPLIRWPEPALQLLGFIGEFLSAGAIGFRFAALRRTRGNSVVANYDYGERRAAVMGAVGALVSILLMIQQLPALAARRHVSVGALITSDALTGIQLTFLLLALIGFALAAARMSAGWPLAAVSIIAGSLRAAFVGKWASLVNPVHVLAAGLWIGTLFVLVIAALVPLLRRAELRDRRGEIAAQLVNAFSPLALSMGGVVVLFGVITAWRHLHVLSALWSTPYGYALIIKLCFVAGVFALGAWNWRRQRPTLGSDAAAASIRRSATAELSVAGVVLIITAVLVSLPSPKDPAKRPATSSTAAPSP